MIPFPKPRGFWDYTLFALVMTGVLLLVFWSEATRGISWADAALATASMALLVFMIIVGRRAEKAKWIAQPTWTALALASLGMSMWMFGTIYADAYLLHRSDITRHRIQDDLVFAIVMAAGTLWTLRRRLRARRPVL